MTDWLTDYAAHMRGEHRYTHLTYEQALESRDRRNAQQQPKSEPYQVRSAATRKANKRASDPILREAGL